MKNKNHLIWWRKNLTKYPFHDKTLNKLGIEGNYHNTYEKATANMLNGERHLYNQEQEKDAHIHHFYTA